MGEFITLDQINQAADYIRSKTTHRPALGLILGSGLNDICDAVQAADVIPFEDIPFWPKSTVKGHVGRVVIGKLHNQVVFTMQGRVHYYEGYSMSQVGFPMRVMQKLEIGTVIVTNAAGAINPAFQPGDVMLIRDQINLIGMGGLNPLRGPNLDEFGPRFPDMSQAYDRAYAEAMLQVAREKKITLHEGVYACLAGPSFETPADLKYLRIIGADAVGMSTVPEVIVARHGGTRVVGISGISNKANLDGLTVTTHEEVLEAGRVIVPKLAALLEGFLTTL